MADYFTLFSFEVRAVQLTMPPGELLELLHNVDLQLAEEPEAWSFEHDWQRTLAAALAMAGHEALPLGLEASDDALWVHDDGRCNYRKELTALRGIPLSWVSSVLISCVPARQKKNSYPFLRNYPFSPFWEPSSAPGCIA